MNNIVLLPLQESMAHHSTAKHDQLQGYITVLVINQGIIKSFTINTSVIRQIIKFDVDNLWDCFPQEARWTLAICYQLSTLSALDLGCIHHLPHAMLQK